MILGLAQLLVEGGEPERNFERAEKLISRASRQGSNWVLLPETVDFSWTHPSSLIEAEPIPGRFSDLIALMSVKYNVWITVGLTEKTSQGNYNTAITFNNLGEIVHKYRKINLLTVEFPYYLVGDSLSVVNTPWGIVGINVCSDNYIDSLHIAHTLARMGAQLILSPSSWTVDFHITETNEPYQDKWLKPMKLIATYYDLVFASCTSVGYIVGGPYEGKKMVGQSLVVNKNGILAQGEMNEFAGDLKIISLSLHERKYKGIEIGKNLSERGYSLDEYIRNI